MKHEPFTSLDSSATVAWTPQEPHTAKIPLRNGFSGRPIAQPLALHQYEWERIGRLMGWLPPAEEACLGQKTGS